MKLVIPCHVRTFALVGASLYFCSALPTHAALPTGPLSTDRPDFTEGVETLAPGRVQIEAGYTFTREGAVRDHAFGEALLRLGSGPRSEIRIGLNSYMLRRGGGENASGFEDSSIGFKVRLKDGEGAQPSVAVLGETTLPTGSDAFGSNRLQPKATLSLGWGLSPALSLGANIGAGLPSTEAGSDKSSYFEGSGSLSLGYDASERVGTFLEVYGFAHGSGGGPNSSYINGGATYLVNPDMQLDARVGMGLNGRSNDYFMGAGVSRRW